NVEASPGSVPRPDDETNGARSHPASASLDALLDDGRPRIAATTVATTVYSKPHTISRRLGYLRLGGIVERDAEAVAGSGCKGKWYRVRPLGYVCTDDATIDMGDPLV